MTRYVIRDGELVEKRYARPLSRHHVISDAMAPVRSMATGKMHDSKSSLRAEYRARGVYEIGNDVSHDTYPTETHDHRTGQRWDEMR